MQLEIDALRRNQTWILVPPTPNQNVLGNRQIFKIKKNADGSIQRYKARLVARGYNQEYGLDYRETFSPVVKPTTVRLILSLATQLSWPIQQLDVHNAFLYGDLQEEVYTTQPLGFINQKFPNYVCKLNKALYGLK